MNATMTRLSAQLAVVVLAAGLLSCHRALPSPTVRSDNPLHFWANRPPADWSERQCSNLLTDSPWAGSYTFGQQPYCDWGECGGGIYLTYTARIWSAWTVRHASSCATLKGSAQSPIVASFASPRPPRGTAIENLVIRVTYVGIEGLAEKSRNYWRSFSPEELLRQAALVIEGRRVYPENIHLGDALGWANGLTLYFPRVLDGKPLFTSSMRKIVLEIADPNGKVRIVFRPKRMIVNGELVY